MKLLKAYSTTKLLIILAGLSASTCLLAGEPFMLVSEQEYLMQLDQKQIQNKKIALKTRSIFTTEQNFPHITINSPALTSALYSPIRVDIKFKTAEGAKIQLDSLRVLYGWLNLDITDRIKKHARVSATGVIAENIKLPVGEHHITIEIMDSMKRSAEKKVSFKVLAENR